MGSQSCKGVTQNLQAVEEASGTDRVEETHQEVYEVGAESRNCSLVEATMDPPNFEFASVALKFRAQSKTAKLSKAVDTSFLSFTNLKKLIFKHFPEIEDEMKSSVRARGAGQPIRFLEVKWKDTVGNYIHIENDEDVEAAALDRRSHVELRIDINPNFLYNDKSSESSAIQNGSGEQPRIFVTTRSRSKPCRYFQAGNCRHGDACRFSHDRVDGPSWRNEGTVTLKQSTNYKREQKDGLLPNPHHAFGATGERRARRTTFTMPSTSLEIDKWLMKQLELAGGQSIEQLCEPEGFEVLSKLAEQKNLNPETINLLVRVLAKDEIRTSLLRHKTNKIYGVLLGSIFLLQLQAHITSHVGIRSQGSKALRPYLFLMEEIQSRTAEGWKEVPLDAMQTVVSRLEEGEEKIELTAMVCRLMHSRDEQQRVLAVAPPDRSLQGVKFRQMTIVASREELVGRQAVQDLPVNRIGIQYSKLSDYLETHFKLLREDCIDPLRQGIAVYKRNRQNPTAGDADGVQELRIYTDVNVAAVRCGDVGIEPVFKFQLSKGEDSAERWESSRRLMPGALLCISSDEFQTFFWGVVARRDVKDLAEGLVAIRMVSESEDDALGGQHVLPTATQTYVMVESTAVYFEAYYHVLKSLQREELESIPFTQHLLHLEPTVRPPSYLLRRQEGDKYDFSTAFPGLEREMGRKSINVLQEWPAGLSDALKLDKAQIDALRQGLTKELAIIQGPPGTGKTFLGIHLVNILLTNLEQRRNDPASAKDVLMNGDSHEQYDLTGPIQIICYTNHALDQFLEGIYKSGVTDLIRIGGRSKSDMLKDRNLRHLLELQRKGRGMDGSHHRFFRDGRSRNDFLEDQIHLCIDKMGLQFASRNLLEGIATREQIRSLFVFGQSELPSSSGIVEFWLNVGWCTDPNLAYHYFLDLKKVEIADDKEKDPRKSRGVIKMLPKPQQEGEWTDVRRRGRRNRNQRRAAHAEDEIGQLIRDEPVQGGQPGMVDDGPLDEVAPLHEFIDRSNVWELNIPQRRALHNYWLDEIRNECRQKLRELTDEYEAACKNLTEVDREIQVALLRRSQVVGMTTTAAAKNHDVVKSLRSEIVVIEEAAEVLEGHILACLSPSVKHLILIGDHLQLRPSVAVYRLATEHKLDVSMFERLVRSGIEHVTLQEQRRMRPAISKLMKSLYPGSRDHESVSRRKDVSGMAQNVFFFDHEAEERNSKDEGGSKVNPTEARLIVELCMYLLNQEEYGPENITILSMYTGQLLEIKGLLKERCRSRLRLRPVRKSEKNPSEESDESLQVPRVSSVDDFQGEENDIIILSLVRSNQIVTRDGIGKIGFLKTENRTCVALTRAREGLFIFGNATLLADKSNLWRHVTESLRNDGALGPQLELYCKNHRDTKTRISKPEDFKQVEDGGCSLPCEDQLDCGHACPRRCHHGSHDLVVCPKPCLKQYEECKHECKRRCHGGSEADTDCPPCSVIVRRHLLNCDHEQSMTCSSKLEKEVCRSACEKLLPCGHQCRTLCGRPCTESCEERVTKVLPCGHVAKISCNQTAETFSCRHPCGELLKDCQHPCEGTCGKCKQGTAHIKCQRKCGRSLPCGHLCEDKCSAPCAPCKRKCRKRCLHSRCTKSCGEMCRPCREECAWKCEHHSCEKRCFEICTRPRCDLPCPKTSRKCGHPCIGLCGEPCPTKCRVCNPETLDVITQMTLGESEEFDRFIQLEDCKHVFEVSGLDTWMDATDTDQQSDGSVAIKLKECPECRTPIMRTTRYSNSVRRTLNQIEEVKKRVLGYDKLKRGNEYLKKADHHSALKWYGEALEQNPGLMEAHFQIGYVFFAIGRDHAAISQFSFVLQRSSLGKRLEDLIKRIEEPETDLTEHNSSREMLALKKYLTQSPARADDALAMKAMVQMASALTGTRKFTDAVQLCDIVLEGDPDNNQARVVKEKAAKGEEVQLVIQAMADDVGQRGHWFQCPNGHYYTIGECGGAMQSGRCPDCNATVGGGSHRLAAGNRPANIDGSDPSSYQWSGGAIF